MELSLYAPFSILLLRPPTINNIIGAGIPTTNNRTNWPITGGDISIIPGWNAGHPTAFFYVNMGFGSTPPNMTNIMLPVFQMTGPSKNPYPGSFCLTQVPLPVNASVKVGDNATIQVIQVALHGASLYNVSARALGGARCVMC